MIKLADFGFSHRIADILPTLEMIPYIDPQFLKGLTNGSYKNYYYEANKKSDIYSVGMVLWEISSGQIPFETFSDDLQKLNLISEIQNGRKEFPISDTPTDYIDIYTSMIFYYII
jgi:serine/threonine protein kinase